MIQLQNLSWHWLQPGPPVKQVFMFEGSDFSWQYWQTDGLIFVIRMKSEGKFSMTGTLYRPVGMREFAMLSSHWHSRTITPEPEPEPEPEPDLPAEPNELPAEPNLAEILAGVTDPNLIPIIKQLMNSEV
jgi:hypothetical protein